MLRAISRHRFPGGLLALRRTVHRLILPLVLVLVCLAQTRVLGFTEPAERVDEYRVKAAILYNLAKFVDWPPDAFADANASLVICVLGSDPFGSVLDDALRGRTIGHRTTIARRIADVTPGCHVLFIARSERKRLAAITDRLRASSVLTVSEDDAFTEQGGMVALSTDGERVRFDINGEAVDRSGLKVSARLLALSTSTRRAGGGSR